MFTLIYNHGQFNRPNNLLSFLQTNIGEWPLIQIDCVTPYSGIEKELVHDVCEYLSGVDSKIEVSYNMTQNCSTESSDKGTIVRYLVIQVHVI